MKCFFRNGTYMQGDMVDGDIPCPPKPDDTTSSFINGQWTIDSNLVKIQEQLQLAETDAGLIRGIEDLIKTLITKGVITNADLPSALVTKLNARTTIRQQIAGGP